MKSSGYLLEKTADHGKVSGARFIQCLGVRSASNGSESGRFSRIQLPPMQQCRRWQLVKFMAV